MHYLRLRGTRTSPEEPSNRGYPTYQHVGPCSSMISVSFLSVGNTLMDSEPQHNDLAELTTMSHTLEEQYLKMRTLFRRTSAIYRTQAVFVENQVLNMCGIHGLMLDQITNETIRDSSNMLSVQMTAGQYENVFEDIGPFRISGISQAYQNTFNIIIWIRSAIRPRRTCCPTPWPFARVIRTPISATSSAP